MTQTFDDLHFINNSSSYDTRKTAIDVIDRSDTISFLSLTLSVFQLFYRCQPQANCVQPAGAKLYRF